MAGTAINNSLDKSDITAAVRDLQQRDTQVVSLTAATLTLSANTHHKRTVNVNRAAGTTITLPASTGSGAKYRIVVGTALTSGSLIVKVANASDVMQGVIQGMSDDPATMKGWKAAAADDTITLNRTTTGVAGLGEVIELEDIAANKWQVSGVITQSGAEATPFSATV